MANFDVDNILKLPKSQRIGILVGIVVILSGLYWFFIGRSVSMVELYAVSTPVNNQKT